MLLVRNWAYTEWYKQPEKWLKPQHIDTHEYESTQQEISN